MGSCITKDTSVYEPEPLIVKNQQEIYGFTGQKQRKTPRKKQHKFDHYPVHRYTADIAALPSYLTLESELDQLERRLTRQRNLSMHLEAEYDTVGHRTLDAMKTHRRRRYAERMAIHYTPHGTYSDH